MIQKPHKKISWVTLMIIGGLVLILQSCITSKTDKGPLGDIPLTIDISETLVSPEKDATDALTVSEYEKTEAREKPKTTRAVYTYSSKGTLTEYTEFSEYSDIEEGLLNMKACNGSSTYSVSADGTTSLLQTNGYSRDDTKEITTEYVNTADGGSFRTDYSLRADGRPTMASLYVYTDSTQSYLMSTETYRYSKTGNLISSTTTYNTDSSQNTTTSYISNTNGDPVKITTKNADGKTTTVETRGYNKDGTIAYSKVCDNNGEIYYRTWYYYDEDGYLIKSVDFEQNTAGKLVVSDIKTYTYFDW